MTTERQITIVIAQERPIISMDSLGVLKVNYIARAGADGLDGTGGTGGGLTEVHNENIVGAIQSNDFDPATNTGWKIDKDAGVIFNDGIFRGAVYFKKADGTLQSMSGMEFGRTYTWIKYAQNSDGTSGFGNDPTGCFYMGLAYNKPTATESPDPADYTWSQFRGIDGINGTGIILKGSVALVADLPVSNNTTGDIYLVLADSHGYVWDGDSWNDVGTIVGPQGVQGIPGANGEATYTWIMYSDHEDGTDLYNVPTESTLYIGISPNHTTQTESTDKADYIWSRFKGYSGVAGPSLYTWLKFADRPIPPATIPSTGISDTAVGKFYLGLAYNKETSVESTDYADYIWNPITATDGLPGLPGANGETLYTWIKYALDESGAGISQSPVGRTYIGIAYNKTTAVESSDPVDYQWALIQGPQGPAGNNGLNGVDGQDLSISYWARENNITFIDGRKIYTGDAFVDSLVIADHAISYPVVTDIATTYGKIFGPAEWAVTYQISLTTIPSKYAIASIMANIVASCYVFGQDMYGFQSKARFLLRLFNNTAVLQTYLDVTFEALGSPAYAIIADNVAKVFFNNKGLIVKTYRLELQIETNPGATAYLAMAGTAVNILGIAR